MPRCCISSGCLLPQYICHIGKVKIHEHKLRATASQQQSRASNFHKICFVINVTRAVLYIENSCKIKQESVRRSSKIIWWKPWHHNQTKHAYEVTWQQQASSRPGMWLTACVSQTWAECWSDDVTVVFCLLALCNSKRHLLNHILILALSDSHSAFTLTGFM